MDVGYGIFAVFRIQPLIDANRAGIQPERIAQDYSVSP